MRKTQKGVIPISVLLVNLLQKKIIQNTRNRYNISMKPESVTKLNKRNTGTSKKLVMMPCRPIVTSQSFFQLMANLEESGDQIPHAWSGKFKLSSTVTFYLTSTANRTKTSLTQLSY